MFGGDVYLMFGVFRWYIWITNITRKDIIILIYAINSITNYVVSV